MAAKSPGLTRRRFLKRSTLWSATPWLVPGAVLGAAGQRPPSQRITTALIGSGSRGQQIMAGGDRVVAVCDVDSKHREVARGTINAMAQAQVCRGYHDFREVLGRDDIDAVVVATPDHWHVPIAAAAIRAGKAVYVEKPLSVAIQEGRLLTDLVARYGGLLQVGSQQRSDEKFIRACELVRNGRLGQLHTVKVWIPTRPGSDKPWSPRPVPPELDYDMWLGGAPWAPYHPDRVHYKFRFVSDYSGGDVTNWGAHQLDIAHMGIGADNSGPIRVEGHGKRNASGLHDVFYDVHVDFTYPGNVTVQLRSDDDPKRNGVRFEGSEGWIFVSRGELTAEPKSILTSRIGPKEIRLGPTTGSETHMGVWWDCIRQRNAQGLNAPAEIGHRSATVCHLANLAMELGRQLKWDPDQEQFVDDPQANRHLWRPMRSPWRI
jgi:predicted dehydrogenase